MARIPEYCRNTRTTNRRRHHNKAMSAPHKHPPGSFVLFLTVLILLGATHAGGTSTATPCPPVGFVTHYHEGDLEKLDQTPVTAELADLIHWRMVDLDEEQPCPESLQLDFSNADGWLPMLRNTGRKGYPIIDTAMYHSTMGWRRAMTGQAGENMVGMDGNEWPFSSLHSPVFRQSVFNYIEQFTEWFQRHDTEGLVPGYLNGAEWFYPGSLDYSPLALAAFRDWLRDKYGSLEAVNTAWAQAHTTWETVTPPRPSVIGGYHVNEPTFALNSGADASFAATPVPVTPSRRYSVSARVSGDGAATRFAGFHLAWLDDADNLITVSAVHAEDGGSAPYDLEGVVQAPSNAAAVIVHCKLLAWGEVSYRNPMLTEEGRDEPLTSRDADDWNHEPYTGESEAHSEGQDETLTLTLKATEEDAVEGNAVLMLEDWVTFSFEAMAAWLNDCAKFIRQCDPDREISSYVGFVFAQLAQWDYAMLNQRLDISLMNTPDIDVNGIQMCIAGDDFAWATSVVDMARKYNKPIRATDLIDFPYGLYSGFEPIYRGTLAAVQHGMTEVFWYGWKGVPDYSYLQRMATADRNRLIDDTRRAIDAVAGYRPHTNLALLSPVMSYSLADDNGYKGDMIDSGGLYRLLLDAGITVDIWTPYEIEHSDGDALYRYDALFVSDCPVLPRAVHDTLLQFVEQGGAIISSGRLPASDLHGASFDAALEAHGRVINWEETLGRRYWGRLRRDQVYGNTPPVLVEAPDPERTPMLRRRLREKVTNALDDLAIPRVVSLRENPGDVHVVPYRNDETGGMLLFLVHTGSGRCHHVDLLIDTEHSLNGATAWRDFDDHAPCVLIDDGVLRTPDFAHACIVTL